MVFTGRHNLDQRKAWEKSRTGELQSRCLQGRAGRTRPGLCFRLCSRLRFTEGLEESECVGVCVCVLCVSIS